MPRGRRRRRARGARTKTRRFAQDANRRAQKSVAAFRRDADAARKEARSARGVRPRKPWRTPRARRGEGAHLPARRRAARAEVETREGGGRDCSRAVRRARAKSGELTRGSRWWLRWRGRAQRRRRGATSRTPPPPKSWPRLGRRRRLASGAAETARDANKPRSWSTRSPNARRFRTKRVRRSRRARARARRARDRARDGARARGGVRPRRARGRNHGVARRGRCASRGAQTRGARGERARCIRRAETACDRGGRARTRTFREVHH